MLRGVIIVLYFYISLWYNNQENRRVAVVFSTSPPPPPRYHQTHGPATAIGVHVTEDVEWPTDSTRVDTVDTAGIHPTGLYVSTVVWLSGNIEEDSMVVSMTWWII